MSTVSLAVEELKARVVGMGLLALDYSRGVSALDKSKNDTGEDDAGAEDSELHQYFSSSFM